MTEVQPFRAIRPVPEMAGRVASPPYDVMNCDEARRMAENEPLSFLHVIRPEIDFSPDVDAHSEAVYARGKQNLDRLVAQGALVREKTPCFYVYEQKRQNHVQAGLVAGASISEYEKGLIKKHEHTRPDKVKDRARHIEVLGGQAGPVFLAIRHNDAVIEVLENFRTGRCLFRFSAGDGVDHAVWKIDDEDDVRLVQEVFRKIPAMYIADGHHRSEAAFEVSKKLKKQTVRRDSGADFFLSVIFPVSSLCIMAYNRIVSDLNGLNSAGFLKKLEKSFLINQTAEPGPENAHSFDLFLEGRWHRLAAKDGIYPADDPVKSLDVSILQETVLGPVLGIEDPRTDPRIDFIGGIRGTEELENRCRQDNCIAFALYPTDIDQLLNVADAGLVMPPKSTWFEPKLRSGLFVRSLED